MENRTFSRSGKHTADDVKSLQPPGMGFKTNLVQEMWFGVSRSVGAGSEILIKRQGPGRVLSIRGSRKTLPTSP